MKLYYKALSGLIDDPHLYSTIRAGQVDPKSGETVEALYDNAAQYCGDISQWLKAFQTEDYPTGDLMQYLHWPDDPQVEAEIRRKIRSAHVTVEASGDLLYARLDLDMTEDLTVSELEAFTEQVESQYRDGWGAEVEIMNIPTADGAVYLRLWHDGAAFFTGAAKDDFERQSQTVPPPSRIFAMKAKGRRGHER